MHSRQMKSHMGKRERSTSLTSPGSQNNSQPRSRLGQRGIKNVSISSMKVVSGKKGVKKCLFKSSGRENHDPILGRSVATSLTSMSETPLINLYSTGHEQNPKTNVYHGFGNRPLEKRLSSLSRIRTFQDGTFSEKHSEWETVDGNSLRVSNLKSEKRSNAIKKQFLTSVNSPYRNATKGSNDFTPIRYDFRPNLMTERFTRTARGNTTKNLKTSEFTPFHNTSNLDVFPDLEGRERTHPDNPWSVFKKPENCKKNNVSDIDTTFQEVNSVLFHSSLKQTHEDIRNVVESGNQNDISYSTNQPNKINTCSNGDISSFNPPDFDSSLAPHRYKQYTSEGLISPTAPKSNCNSYMMSILEKTIKEEPKPQSNFFSNPLLQDMIEHFKINRTKETQLTNCDTKITTPVIAMFDESDPNDSFVANESSILGSQSNSNSIAKKRLSKIVEENNSHCTINESSMTLEEEISQNSLNITAVEKSITDQIRRDSLNHISSDSDLRSTRTEMKSGFVNICKMVDNLLKEKKLADQKEIFLNEEMLQISNKMEILINMKNEQKISRHKLDEDLTKLQTTLNDFKAKFIVEAPQDINMLTESLKESLQIKPAAENTTAGVKISTKSNHLSHNKTPPPNETFIDSPSNRRSARLKAAQTLTELRASYTCLKTTPEASVKKRCPRQSNCYTPHSLSLCVDDQVKNIFGID